MGKDGQCPRNWWDWPKFGGRGLNHVDNEGVEENAPARDEWAEAEKEIDAGMEEGAYALGDDEDAKDKKSWSSVVRGYKAPKATKAGTDNAKGNEEGRYAAIRDEEEYDEVGIQSGMNSDDDMLITHGTPPGLEKVRIDKERKMNIKHAEAKTADAVEKVTRCLGALRYMGEDDFEQKILAMEDKWEWDCIEAVVDSGSVDTVINPKRLPGHKVVETDDSRNGAHWTCAGSTKIAKIGMIRLPWVTNDNERMRTAVMVGAVGKTLVSTHRLDETGYDTMLTKINPRIFTENQGR